MTDLPDDVAFAHRAAYLREADALVVADLHLGRAAVSDVQLPVGEGRDVTERFEAVVERFAPGTVVVAGDLLHAFDALPGAAEAAVAEVRDRVLSAGANLVVTPGNHDGLLGQVHDGRTPAEHNLSDGTVVCHGHEPPDAAADRYVVGHDHPAITIEGVRHPCFLYGPRAYRGADVLALPAFSRAARGVAVGDAREGDLMSPLLTDVDRFRPVVRDEDAGETLPFPPLARLREHL